MDRRDVRGALVIGAAHLAVPGGILLIAESERPGEGWSRAMGLPDFPGFPPLLAYGGAVAALAFALAARRNLGASRAAGLIVALDLVVLAVAGVLGHDVSTVLSFAAVPLVAAMAVLGRRPVTG